MPSRHRSENKQRRTAGDGAALKGRREKKNFSRREDNQTAVNKNTLSVVERNWGCQSTELRQTAANVTKTTPPPSRTTEQSFSWMGGGVEIAKMSV